MRNYLKSGSILLGGLFSLGLLSLTSGVASADPFNCSNLFPANTVVFCNTNKDYIADFVPGGGSFVGQSWLTDQNVSVNKIEFWIIDNGNPDTYTINIQDITTGLVLASASTTTSWAVDGVASVTFDPPINIATSSQVFMGITHEHGAGNSIFGNIAHTATGGCAITNTRDSTSPFHYTGYVCNSYGVGYGPDKRHDLYIVVHGEFKTFFFPTFNGGNPLELGNYASATLGFSNSELEAKCDAKFGDSFLASIPRGVCYALVFAFNPSQESLQNFTGLWTNIQFKPPIGAFYLVTDVFSTLASGEANASVSFAGFTALTNPIKTGLTYVLLLMLALWVIHRISRHEV